MAIKLSTATRTGRATAIVTEAGTDAIGELWNGTAPASEGGTPAGTKLAEFAWSGAIGTVSNGALTWNTSITQTNSGHVNGTPTFLRIKKSGGTFVADIDIGAGSANAQFTGAVQANVNVVINSGSTLTEANGF